jgi:hypothetical protein
LGIPDGDLFGLQVDFICLEVGHAEEVRQAKPKTKQPVIEVIRG